MITAVGQRRRRGGGEKLRTTFAGGVVCVHGLAALSRRPPNKHDRAAPPKPPPATGLWFRPRRRLGSRTTTDPALEAAKVFARDEERGRQIVAERAFPLFDGHVLERDVGPQVHAMINHRYLHLAPPRPLIGEERPDLCFVRQVCLHHT